VLCEDIECAEFQGHADILRVRMLGRMGFRVLLGAVAQFLLQLVKYDENQQPGFDGAHQETAS
jgi:hypothetical protein